jgi:prophage regulatory protein
MTQPQQNYQVLRMKDLPAKVGLKPSTIYALIAKEKFPRPFKFITGGRAAGWMEQTIDEWLAERAQNQPRSVAKNASPSGK